MPNGSVTQQLDTNQRTLPALYQPGNTATVLPMAGTVLTDANNSSQSYAPTRVELATSAGTSVAANTVGEVYTVNGGKSTTAVAAAAAAAAIKASPGALHKVLVTTAGTAALTFYDNASAASGTILLTIPANAAAGTIYDVQFPAAAGIYCNSGTNTPAVTVGWS